MSPNITQNAKFLEEEFQHLVAMIQLQGELYTKNESIKKLYEYPLPALKDGGKSPYCSLLKQISSKTSKEIAFAERFVLLLALAPYLKPQLLDVMLVRRPDNLPFTEYGDVGDTSGFGFQPSVQTALFLLGGNDLARRIQLQQLFTKKHPFLAQNILVLDDRGQRRGFLEKGLAISEEYLSLLTTGKTQLPDFSREFPAVQLRTKMEWEDLVLPKTTFDQIKELEHWINYQGELDKIPELARRLKPGFRAIFHGASGTGKTLTASLLGKFANLPVFRIDLSQMVSKYIGETEKNLSKLFAKAEHKNWMLFFDEADALFGKRTNTQNAHDKYANQETAYLLQRIEHYNGMVILASNFKSNIDKAFLRRFQAIIHFPKPKYLERIRLWNKAFPKEFPLSEEIQLEKIAQKYELTGAHIINIVHTSCLSIVAKGEKTITAAALKAAIEKEYLKEGRIMG